MWWRVLGSEKIEKDGYEGGRYELNSNRGHRDAVNHESEAI